MKVKVRNKTARIILGTGETKTIACTSNKDAFNVQKIFKNCHIFKTLYGCKKEIKIMIVTGGWIVQLIDTTFILFGKEFTRNELIKRVIEDNERFPELSDKDEYISRMNVASALMASY